MRTKVMLLISILLISLMFHACSSENETPDLLHSSGDGNEISGSGDHDQDESLQVYPDFSGYDAEFITSPVNDKVSAACITALGNSYLVIRQQDGTNDDVSYTPVCVFPHEKEKICNLSWAPDGSKISYLEKTENSGGGGQYCKVSIYDPAKTTKCNAKVYWWSSSPAPTVEWFPDSDRLLIASRPITIFTCSSGETVWVSQDKPASGAEYAPDEFAKSMETSLSPDGRHVAYELIGEKSVYLMLYDVETQGRCELGVLIMPIETSCAPEKPIWNDTSSVKWCGTIYRMQEKT